jgi:cell fate regulator YaaT (PSP1 superfamily)
MPIVCGVQFRGAGKVYFFSPGDIADIHEDDHVIVETSRGRELGKITQAPHEVEPSRIVGELKAIVQRATPLHLLEAQRIQQQEPQAMETCQQQISHHNLPMKVVQAEYNYDGSRLTFFFSSEERVDFRELVRELAHIFKTRIELRQIGVRDEAKLIGGLGKCGRPLCCATWLTDFCPVSIRMAKQQDLPLSPMEISGLCGRLLCCLVYENDYYQEVKARFPRVGKRIETPVGPGKVIKVSVFTEMVTILMEDGSILELTADQVAGKAPIEPPEADEPQNDALAEALGALSERETIVPPPRPANDAPRPTTQQVERREAEEPTEQRSSRRRSRGGRNRRPRSDAPPPNGDGSGNGESSGGQRTGSAQNRPPRRPNRGQGEDSPPGNGSARPPEGSGSSGGGKKRPPRQRRPRQRPEQGE